MWLTFAVQCNRYCFAKFADFYCYYSIERVLHKLPFQNIFMNTSNCILNSPSFIPLQPLLKFHTYSAKDVTDLSVATFPTFNNSLVL